MDDDDAATEAGTVEAAKAEAVDDDEEVEEVDWGT